MRSSSSVLVPLALLALVLCAPCAAQTPTAAPLSAVASPPAPSSVAAFLATLSGGAAVPPDPRFLTTTCHSNYDCPTGQICCYPCGIEGCEFICMAPWRKTGECPPFV